jgi:hypothetical protein
VSLQDKTGGSPHSFALTAFFALPFEFHASISEIFGVTHSNFPGIRSLRSVEVISRQQAAGSRQIIPTQQPICRTLQHQPTRPPQRPDKTSTRPTQALQAPPSALNAKSKRPALTAPDP